MANGNGDDTGAYRNGNSYRIRSWGDVVAVASLLAMLLSTVAWGLKLEAELNELRSSHGPRLANLEARVADGILPRAEERIIRYGDELKRCERRLDLFEQRLDAHRVDHPGD